jgi:hypothetical protein
MTNVFRLRAAALVSIVALVVLTTASLAWSATADNYWIQTSGLCGDAHSQLFVSGDAPASAAQLVLQPGCGSFSSWPSGYLAIDGAVYDQVYPSIHVCSSNGNHPTGQNYTSYVTTTMGVPLTCTRTPVGGGCYAVISHALGWMYIGYPPSWQNGTSSASGQWCYV